METYADLLPKKKRVKVGMIELSVAELSIAKRDAAMKIFLNGLDIVTLLKTFQDVLKQFMEPEKSGKGDSEKLGNGVALRMLDMDITKIAESLQGIVTKFFGGNLSEIICIALDSKENVAECKTSDEESKSDEHGYIFHPALFSWLKDNLTMRQEHEILKAIAEVNDLAGLLKNYATLVGLNLAPTREGSQEKIA